MTTYISPFGVVGGTDHNGQDALCLSRTHCTDAAEETLQEFYVAATAVIASRPPQPAFFLARQLAELAQGPARAEHRVHARPDQTA